MMYGKGLAYPARASSAGRLVRSEGDERILESIEAILETDKGTCPLDPAFGVDAGVYDPLSQAELFLWAIANAIEYAEPRVDEIDVVLTSYDTTSGTAYVSVTVKPIGSTNRLNRVFPVYRKV